MYLTLEETADYLDIEISEVYRLVREKQIRTVSDGEELLSMTNNLTYIWNH